MSHSQEMSALRPLSPVHPTRLHSFFVDVPHREWGMLFWHHGPDLCAGVNIQAAGQGRVPSGAEFGQIEFGSIGAALRFVSALNTVVRS